MEWWKAISAWTNPDYMPAEDLTRYYFGKAFEAQKNGSLWETIKVNLWEGQLASLYWAWTHGRFFQTAALFMLGMLMGRQKLLEYSEQHMKIWFAILGFAIVSYFPLVGLKNMLPGFVEVKAALISLELIFQSLANFAFTLMLVAGIILTFYTTRMRSLYMKITPYGKMSLTNYVFQSIIGSMLFYNWGFGLDRYLGITASFIVGIILFVFQFMFSNWWMKKYKQGPLEYIWKKGTWIGSK